MCLLDFTSESEIQLSPPSWKSWSECLEHVEAHNKGIALQTTRKIGTQLSLAEDRQKDKRSGSVPVAAALTGARAKQFCTAGDFTRYTYKHWGTNANYLLKTV